MIPAKYKGTCRGCGEGFPQGSWIDMRDDTWMCIPCTRLYDDAERALGKSAAAIDRTVRGTAGNAARGYKMRAKRRSGHMS